MIGALVIFAAAMAQQEAPRVVTRPPLERKVTDHDVAVLYHCALTDQKGQVASFVLKKSGKQTYLGEYVENDATTKNPLIEAPNFQILSGSDSRFASALRYVPGAQSVSPSVGSRGDVVFLDDTDMPVALFRFPAHYETSEGVPLAAFLPKPNDPKSLETLAGVCSRERIEDQPK